MSRKNSLSRIALTTLFALTLSGLVVSNASADPVDSTTTDTQSQSVQNPSDELTALREELANLESVSATEVENYNKAVEDKTLADAEAAKAQKAHEKAQTAYTKALKEHKKAEAEVKVAKDNLGDYASSVYKNGPAVESNVTDITNIVTSGELTESARGMEMVSYVQDRKSDSLVAMKTAESKAAGTKKDAEDKKADAESKKTDADNKAKTANDKATLAEEASVKAQESVERTILAVTELENNELEKERLAKEEADALAAFTLWESTNQAERDAQLATLGATGVGITEEGAAAAPQGPTAASTTALEFAFSQIGKPYIWGSMGPAGFDCSGLTSAAYASAGIGLPRTSSGQSTFGTTVSVSDLQPGDLVFFNSPVTHVGIYAGGGYMVHATKPGDTIKLAKMWTSPVTATRVG